MRKRELTTTIMVLQQEIAYFKTQLQPHDTGHIHTTINTLEDRINSLKDSLYDENQAQKKLPFEWDG